MGWIQIGIICFVSFRLTKSTSYKRGNSSRCCRLVDVLKEKGKESSRGMGTKNQTLPPAQQRGAGRVSLKSLFFESKGPENGLQQNPSGKAAQQYHKYGIETIKSGTNKRGQE